VDVPPPRPAAVIAAPGATMSTLVPLLEKHVTSSVAVVASVQPKDTEPTLPL
jgi:hypothetical protein